MIAALIVGILVTGGIYLILQNGLIRITFGFVLLGHAANVLLLSSGGLGRRAASLLGTSTPDEAADPLPQAFALTAIVITFGITVVLLAVARIQATRTGVDDTDDAGETGDTGDTVGARERGS